MPATMTIGGMASGLLSGAKTIGPSTDTTTGSGGGITDLSLVPGDNTVTAPPNAARVAIFLPPAASQTVTIRTDLNQTDAGLQITPYAGNPWSSFPLPPGTSQVILNSSDVLPGVELSFIGN